MSARRHSPRSIVLAILSLGLPALALAGCSSQSAPQASGRAATDVSRTPDPLVTAVLAHLKAAKPAPVEGTVIGYLVDWEVVETSSTAVGRSITELVVLGDGSLQSVVHPRTINMPAIGRPGGAFGALPDKRLGPEPADAAATRVRALPAAQRVIDRLQSEYSSAALLVFDYLIRVRRDDGTVRQVWFTPAGQIDRELVGTWLKKWPAPRS